MKTTEAKATHTPGPWQALDNNHTGIDIDIKHEPFAGGTIATIWNGADDDAPGEMEWANARLIAAAPDLLAACNELLAMLKEWSANPDEMSGFSEFKGVHVARAAIAKATGS